MYVSQMLKYDSENKFCKFQCKLNSVIISIAFFIYYTVIKLYFTFCFIIIYCQQFSVNNESLFMDNLTFHFETDFKKVIWTSKMAFWYRGMPNAVVLTCLVIKCQMLMALY